MRYTIQCRLFPFLILLIFILFSCDTGGGTPAPGPTTELSQDTVVTTLQTVPYLDIPNSAIYNCNADLEYSQDGGNTWSDCTGGIQTLSLSIGDHVLLRDSSDTSWQRDLGTVDRLSSVSDLTPGNKIYVGDGYTQDGVNYWNDDNLVKQGETVDIYSGMINLGSSDSYTYTIRYYLSGDNLLNPDEDLLIKTIVLDYPSDNFAAYNNIYLNAFTYTVSTAQEPGIYYLGMVIDTENELAELNENNNQSLPEEMTPIVVTDASSTNGAFKVVNSWGEGYWENTADGSYWLPFETMKANEMGVWYFTNGFENEYAPTSLAVFEIDHNYRDEVMISFGIGDPANPLVEKNFDAYSENPQGGALPFPANKMVLDISELAYLINDGDLFMRIQNSDSTSGTMVSFAAEFYDPATGNLIDYGTNYVCTTTNNTFNTNGETVYTISTEGNFSTADLKTITVDINKGLSSGLVFSSPSSSDLGQDLKALGGSPAARTSTPRIHRGQFGTGYIPPTKEELDGFLRLNTDTMSVARSSFNGMNIPLSVDNSQHSYFPPIGDQGQEGSCAAFSVGYYIQTYIEGKERGWDFSGTSWDNNATSTNGAGAPDSNLDKIFSPDFLYHQINGGDDNGSNQAYAMQLVLQQGGATWSTMPYSDSDVTSWPSEEAWREAPQYRGNQFGNLYWDDFNCGFFVIRDNNDIQMLKSLLASGYIVSTAIDSVTFLGGTYPDYAGGGEASSALSAQDVVASGTRFKTYTSDGETYTYIDHAQTIVGYKEGSEWDPSNPDA